VYQTTTYLSTLNFEQNNSFKKNLVLLQTLDLFNNKISTITNETFNGLINLNSLDLRVNPITSLDENAFSSIPNNATIQLP